MTHKYEYIAFHHIFGGTVECCCMSYGSWSIITSHHKLIGREWFHIFSLHCEDFTKYVAANVMFYCLVFMIRIIFGPKKALLFAIYVCWAEEWNKGNGLTKLTNISDKIFKCRTNDKSLIERKCPDQNLFQRYSFRRKRQDKATMADCLGQGVVDILRFADRSSFGPSWLPLQSGPSPPL